MSIADKLTTIAENEQKVYDSGREMGQSDIWDMVQNFGNRTTYTRGFMYWSGKNFKPKYPIQTDSCEYMFSNFATDEEAVDLRGIDLDTSKSGTFNYMCNFANISAFGTIDTTSAADIKNIFYNATALHTIEKLVLKADGSQTVNATNTFRSCSNLVNIYEIVGKFGSNLGLTYSTVLSKNSICQVVNALLDTASGKTLTLSTTAVKKAFETSEGANDGNTSAEWNALIATKPNWTIALS